MPLHRLPCGILLALNFAAFGLAAAHASAPATPAQRVTALESQMAQARAELQMAQLFNRPPASIPNAGPDPTQVQAQDQSGLLVRVDRLESQMRDLTGQLQQMQFDLHKVQTDMQKFQQDVDFRFQNLGHGGAPATVPAAAPPAAAPRLNKRGDAGDPTSTVLGQGDGPLPAAPAPADTRVARGGDAFDPTADPNAVGAPRILGTLPAGPAGAPPASSPGQFAAAAPIDTGAADGPMVIAAPIPGPDPLNSSPPNTDQPLDLRPSVARGIPAASAPDPNALPGPAAIMSDPTRSAAIAPTAAAGPTIVAALPPNDARSAFDQGMNAFNQNSYDAAEASFRAFLTQYPKDKLVPDAIFYLGETYYKRNRPREAAEQYLKISTDYSRSARAPDGLLRLGQALDQLGAKDQACAAFAEVDRKYPNAPATVRLTSDREAKRVQC